jgi:hypothetical protein
MVKQDKWHDVVMHGITASNKVHYTTTHQAVPDCGHLLVIMQECVCAGGGVVLHGVAAAWVCIMSWLQLVLRFLVLGFRARVQGAAGACWCITNSTVVCTIDAAQCSILVVELLHSI